MRRTFLLTAVLADLILLSAATAWVFRSTSPSIVKVSSSSSPNSPGVVSNSQSAAPTASTPAIAASNAPAAVAPGIFVREVTAQPASVRGDRASNGGPKFAYAGAADLLGGVWLGGDGEGVWRFQDNAWRPFTKADGLASDNISAIGCDKQGRVWVGHTEAGVSIFNGTEWHVYDRFSGIGGSHISAIACCPTDGDVWLGTENGMTRYSPARQTWTQLIRGIDIPEGQANGIAFDSAGNVFVAMSDNGVAMATAADGYKKWRVVVGPDMMPITETGSGLPGKLVNAIAVGPNDVVFAGTCRGLARSDDHGMTWNYLRGKNWPAMAVGRYDGLPPGFQAVVATPLLADWVSSLAFDAAGHLWIGYRQAGYQVFSDLSKPADFTGKGNVYAVVPSLSGINIIGTYGETARQCGQEPAAQSRPANTSAEFPAPAAAPTIAEIDAWRSRIESLPAGGDGIAFLNDDWQTTGSWEGHYGSTAIRLMGYQWGAGFAEHAGYSIEASTGPYRRAFMRYYWLGGDDNPAHPRGLLDPKKGRRVFCENNDESYSTAMHPLTQEGPDVYVRVVVPGGVNRVSLYFENFDGRSKGLSQRDYNIDVKRSGDQAAQKPKDDDLDAAYYDSSQSGSSSNMGPATTIEAELSPTLVSTRVSQFYHGVWKRFITRGAGTYWFKIGRNHSECTKIHAVAIDRLDEPTTSPPGYPRPPEAVLNRDAAGIQGAAARLWAALDAHLTASDFPALSMPARLEAYRAAAGSGADESTLGAWRWVIGAWTSSELTQFATYEASLPHTPVQN